MTQRSTTNPIWTNPADPLAQYRYGNPSNLLWNRQATTTQQPERVPTTSNASRDCCGESLLAIVVLVVSLFALALALWRNADRAYE